MKHRGLEGTAQRVGIWALAIAAGLFIGSEATSASFDCAKASHPVERIVCADTWLSAEDERIASEYRKAMASAPAEIRAFLKKSQQEWVKYTRTLCREGRSDCVRSAYSNWKPLEGMIESHGRFKFATIRTYRAERHSSESLDGGEDGARFSTLLGSYALMWEPKDIAESWNERSTCGRELQEGAQTSEDLVVYFASDSLISASCGGWRYNFGTPHGESFGASDNYLLREGRPMGIDDLFFVDSRWREHITDFVMKEMEARDDECMSRTQGQTRESISEQISSDRDWNVSESGLWVSVSNSSCGEVGIKVPWSIVADDVAPQAPIPVEWTRSSRASSP